MKTKKEIAPEVLTSHEESEEEYYSQYQQWININNNGAGTINVTIRQYGKPKPVPPPPDE